MKKELQEKIFKDFDSMFFERNLDMKKTAMCWSLDVEDGWYQLIYDTCQKIKLLVKDDFRFVQVKEKFGELRMYSNCANDEVEKIIDEATKKSITICEECGEEGKLREDQGHWFRTRCDKCWAKIVSK